MNCKKLENEVNFETFKTLNMVKQVAQLPKHLALGYFTICHVICSCHSTNSAETRLVKHIQFMLDSDSAFPSLTCITCCRQYYRRTYSFNLVPRLTVLDRYTLFSRRNTPAALSQSTVHICLRISHFLHFISQVCELGYTLQLFSIDPYRLC